MWCLEIPPLTLRGRIFFVCAPSWVILDSLESLRDVEPIHIMLEVMGGHGRTQKFIFLALFMLSLLQNFLRRRMAYAGELERSFDFHLLPPCFGSSFISIRSYFS